MSRSNPSENSNPNPAKRRFEWNGETGSVRYYDKDEKRQIDVGTNFAFILLDQVGTIGGWHDASESAIYSNEVKDTRQEPFVVKAFKGGVLAEGVYKQIKDHVTSKAVGGSFVTRLYIAFKGDDGGLAIGTLNLKGAALGGWMDFVKDNRKSLYEKALQITGYTEGKKGRITFRVPTFEVKDLHPDTNTAALVLDQELQAYFATYFKRPKRDQVADSEPDDQIPDDPDPVQGELTDDDIPF